MKHIKNKTMNAEEFYLEREGKPTGITLHTPKETKEFAEAYLQHRVNEITDEDIENEAFNLSYKYRDDDTLLRQDAVAENCEEIAKWFKNKLLKL